MLQRISAEKTAAFTDDNRELNYVSPSEIEKQVPNGFHGGVIERLSIDYTSNTAVFAVKLLVPGDLKGCSRKRSGRFEVMGLVFCALDPPSPAYDYMSNRGLEVGSLLEATAKLLPRLQDFREQLGHSVFFHSFFVEEWNGFIHFAGTNAAFEWLEA